MGRDKDKTARKDSEMIKDGSFSKAQAHILMRNQGPSTILQTISQKSRDSNEGFTNRNKIINSDVAKDIIENN